MSDEIIVTGTRLKDDGGASSSWFMPLFLAGAVQSGGTGTTIGAAQFSTILAPTQILRISMPGYNFKIEMKAEDWAKLSPEQQAGFKAVFDHFAKSADLKAALQHSSDEGVPRIILRVSEQAIDANGQPIAWGSADEVARVSHIPSPGDPTNTDIIIGSSVIVTFRESTLDRWPTNESAGKLLIHELLHPATSDFGGELVEHQRLQDPIQRATDAIFGTSGLYIAPAAALGTGVLGSSAAETFNSGGGDDVLAGMAGDDNLSGGAGNDLLLGGLGRDILSGGTGSNEMVGGTEADIYRHSAGARDLVFDGGGVERIELTAFVSGQLRFEKVGTSLVIHTPNGGSVVVEKHYVAANRIEQFAFSDGTFAASWVEYQAAGGQPPPGQHLAYPVVLDLDGDGIELIDLAQSRARFDVDGRKERIGWVNGDDGILTLDRNGNGRVDSFSELSFVDDFLGAGSDLEGLMAYDSDGDGFLTKSDTRWNEFRIWQDRNSNGRSEKHELKSLDAIGITSIDLERKGVPTTIGDNELLATSSFTMFDGSMGIVGDVALGVAYRPSPLAFGATLDQSDWLL